MVKGVAKLFRRPTSTWKDYLKLVAGLWGPTGKWFNEHPDEFMECHMQSISIVIYTYRNQNIKIAYHPNVPSDHVHVIDEPGIAISSSDARRLVNEFIDQCESKGVARRGT